MYFSMYVSRENLPKDENKANIGPSSMISPYLEHDILIK